MSELRFDGRVAVISGAGRGLGRAYALLLASRGAKVVVNDNGSAIAGAAEDRGPAESVVEEIRRQGGTAIVSTASVASPDEAAQIVCDAIDAFGRIDILVHNAGNVRRAPIHEMSDEAYHSVVDVHLSGGFYLARAAIPHMREQQYGRFVLTSSIGGFYGNANVVNYCVAKAGLMGLSRAIAIENAEFGIQSNLILPGAVTRLSEGIDTSQFPPMEPDMVAPMVGWLAHESCDRSGEIFAETQGVFAQDWTIETIAARLDEITTTEDEKRFGLNGFQEHLGFSFAMAKAN
jgi:NAD(P)-dependent dehydrogenase (short-subunit alcohol dehydrogenase family)